MSFIFLTKSYTRYIAVSPLSLVGSGSKGTGDGASYPYVTKNRLIPNPRNNGYLARVTL
jgi:hypothetical protein